MEENLQRKINVCKRMGGRPQEMSEDDILCDGVDEGKFMDELKKDKR